MLFKIHYYEFWKVHYILNFQKSAKNPLYKYTIYCIYEP